MGLFRKQLIPIAPATPVSYIFRTRNLLIGPRIFKGNAAHERDKLVSEKENQPEYSPQIIASRRVLLCMPTCGMDGYSRDPIMFGDM